MDSAALWSWIADSRCYSTFLKVKNSLLGDAEEVVVLFMDVANSLCYDKTILQNAKWNLDNGKFDAANIRIFLACLAIRITVGKEPLFFSQWDASSLEPILQFLSKLRLCFNSRASNLGLCDKMWCISFKHIIAQTRDADKKQEVADDILKRFGDIIPKTVLKSCRNFMAKENYRPTAAYLYSQYVAQMLDCMCQMNSILGKPFLVKIEEKIQYSFSRRNEHLPLSNYKHICEVLNGQIVILNSMKFSPTVTSHSKTNVQCFSDNDLPSLANSDESSIIKHPCDNSSSSINDFSDEYFSPQRSGLDESESEKSISISYASAQNFPSSSGKSTQVEALRNTKRRVWSLELDACIIQGVKMFGVGSWTKIKENFPFPTLNTGTHIKDRWRTMVKNNLVVVDNTKQLKHFDECYVEPLKKLKQDMYKVNSNPKKLDFGDTTTFKNCLARRNKVSCAESSKAPKTRQTFKRSNSLDLSQICTAYGKENWKKKLDACIILGVIAYGIGSWETIKTSLMLPKTMHATRIKDRWRVLLKNNLVEINQGKVSYANCYKKYIADVEKILKISSSETFHFPHHGVVNSVNKSGICSSSKKQSVEKKKLHLFKKEEPISKRTVSSVKRRNKKTIRKKQISKKTAVHKRLTTSVLLQKYNTRSFFKREKQICAK